MTVILKPGALYRASPTKAPGGLVVHRYEVLSRNGENTGALLHVDIVPCNDNVAIMYLGHEEYCSSLPGLWGHWFLYGPEKVSIYTYLPDETSKSVKLMPEDLPEVLEEVSSNNTHGTHTRDCTQFVI